MTSMPQTFRDAVLITRELGIEYLWIDSLCILQDSRKDWQKESSKMGAIFGNTFLTISAAGSTDSTQGIFRPRAVPSLPPVKIQPRDSDFTDLYIAEFLENIPFEKPQPIDSRAWCLQEMALSPHMLVYGTQMLGWLCDSTTDVEHGGSLDHEEDPSPPLLVPRLCRIPRQNPLKSVGNMFDLPHHLAEKERATGRWASIVNEFTRRNLTFDSDRLPALSGLAKEIQLETSDEYLAGLWRKDLRYELLWNVNVLFSKESTEWKRPAGYRTPSWSWASIEGPVTIPLKSNTGINEPEMREIPETYQLLEAKVDYVQSHAFGEVTGGYLKLHAALKKVTIQKHERTMAGDLQSSTHTPWREEQIWERYYRVLTLQSESLGRCCLDIPNERNWGLIDLWWLSLDIHEGLLITNAQKKGEYVRVGKVWFHDQALQNGIALKFSEEREQVILL